MSIARTSFISSARGGINVKKSSHDSYENNIKKQINALEEKMKTISSDDKKPAEQKTKERQAAQEQLQNLNQELREYQMRKRQEEEEKRQEAVKDALESANEPNSPTPDTGFGSREAGVMISLSSTQSQLAGMVRLRTSLEGKQRTAESEEEKEDLQKRIDRLSSGIGQKLSKAKNAISDYQKKSPKDDDNRQTQKQPKADAKAEEVFWTDTKPAPDKPAAAGKLTDKNKPFENISFVVK